MQLQTCLICKIDILKGVFGHQLLVSLCKKNNETAYHHSS